MGVEIKGDVVFASDHFDVYVGIIPEDAMEQFLVINRAYGVVEFACANEYMWRAWIPEMEDRLREQAFKKAENNNNIVKLHN